MNSEASNVMYGLEFFLLPYETLVVNNKSAQFCISTVWKYTFSLIEIVFQCWISNSTKYLKEKSFSSDCS